MNIIDHAAAAAAAKPARSAVREWGLIERLWSPQVGQINSAIDAKLTYLAHAVVKRPAAAPATAFS